jgi:hypothetical protein
VSFGAADKDFFAPCAPRGCSPCEWSGAAAITKFPSDNADAFPGAQREVAEDGGHWIPISKARSVALAIRAVLA